jgi:hypothetical protein
MSSSDGINCINLWIQHLEKTFDFGKIKNKEFCSYSI